MNFVADVDLVQHFLKILCFTISNSRNGMHRTKPFLGQFFFSIVGANQWMCLCTSSEPQYARSFGFEGSCGIQNDL